MKDVLTKNKLTPHTNQNQTKEKEKTSLETKIKVRRRFTKKLSHKSLKCYQKKEYA